MANLINDLIDVLEAQTGCYNELLNMANNKRDVIIDGDLPSLQKITSDEQVVAGQILRLEKKRNEVINDISLVTTINADDLNLSRLIERLKGKEEEEKLIEVRAKMSDVVFELKEANKMNEILIKQSLELFDYTMNALRSVRQTSVVNNYDAGSTSSNHSLFDSRQ